MELIHRTIKGDAAVFGHEERSVRRAVQCSCLFSSVKASPFLSLCRRLVHGEPDGELSHPTQDRSWRLDNSVDAMLLTNIGKIDRGLGNHLRSGNQKLEMLPKLRCDGCVRASTDPAEPRILAWSQVSRDLKQKLWKENLEGTEWFGHCFGRCHFYDGMLCYSF